MEITSEKLKKSTAELPKAVFCMDGRIRPNNPELRPFIGLAGSGVLLSDQQIDVFVSKMKSAGINTAEITVTWHEHCGACTVYKEEHPEDTREQDELAQWGAERLARKLGSTKPVVKIGWSKSCPIKAEGDPNCHTEPAIILDYIGKLNPQLVGLDDSFLLSHAYAPDNDWKKRELGIALSIAMGEHGLGKNYFAKSPMPIYIVGNNVDIDVYNQVISHYQNLLLVNRVQPSEG